jgi:hypothetical protein
MFQAMAGALNQNAEKLTLCRQAMDDTMDTTHPFSPEVQE